MAEEPEEDTKVPLGHRENGRRGRQCAQTGKVEEEDLKEVTPVVERVELVGLVVIQTGFLDDFSFLKLLTLLPAAVAVAVAAVGRGARSDRVLPR